MKKIPFGCLLLCLAATCFGQNEKALCPRHIETPDYPQIARTAHLSGKVSLTVTIDADGKVTHVETMTDDPVARAHPVLQKYAAENIQRWTFSRPLSAPYTEVIVYDYEFDTTLPGEGGPSSQPAITKVSFDLPDRVTILTNVVFIDHT